MFPLVRLASLGLLAAASDPSRPTFDCSTDTKHASDDFLQAIKSLHGGSNSGSPAARAALASRDGTTGPIAVDAVFHIVSTNDKKSSVTNDMPNSQIDALNKAYAPYDISFNLINVTWTTNDAWAVGQKADDDEMKKSLRQGSYRTLNLYFQTDLTDGVLGHPTVYFNDGCNINAQTMPGGPMNGYNAGMTAVHETGHWMGLLHTFEGYSCDGPGDYIDDTPVEKEATDGCPTSPAKRSCPDQQKADESDSIHKYMDYSIDSCYEGFTALQVDRMRSMWGMYRAGN
ncbi:zincin [Setomelanomma holmii]|uniref:Zincin n=1 Tax=Setomelanomma holmii TaxID=210430 RepID=A0A9P4LKE7_9PLEO|nr:zincin [Setomelanomma holmii]